MPPSSTAMELKVLISILQSGQALPNLLNQVNQLSAGLTKLQQQANATGTQGPGVTAANAATAAANKMTAATQQSAAALTSMGMASRGAVSGLQTFEGAMQKVWRVIQLATSGFLAFQSVRLAKDLADTAARTEVLTTVLHVVARNAGVSADEIDRVSEGVQKLGITAQSANQSLTQFLQAKLDVSFAEPLARAAQDLAVISGMDSSQTFSRLLLNIQQLDTMGLRWMGIVVSMTEATQRYADSHGKMASALSQSEKQQALLNEVLEKAKGLQGSYEAAMGNVGKQITSLVRLTTNLKDSLGQQLLPAYSALISEVSLFLDLLNDEVRANNANMDAAQAFAEVVRSVTHNILQLTLVLYRHKDIIQEVAIAYGLWKTATVWLPAFIAFIGPKLVAIGITLVSLTEMIWGISAAFVGLFGVVGAGATILTGGVFAGIVAVIAGLLYGVHLLYTRWVSGAREAKDASSGLYEITQRLAEAKKAEEQAKVAATKAMKEGALEEQKVTKQALKDASDARKKIETERSEYEANLKKKDPAAKAAEEEYLRNRQRMQFLEEVAKAASAAKEKLDTTSEGFDVINKNFAQGLGGLKDLTNQFIHLRQEEIRAGQATDEFGKTVVRTTEEITAAAINQQSALSDVVEQARNVAAGVASKTELKRFLDQLAYDRALLEQEGSRTGATPQELDALRKRLTEAEQRARLGARKGELEYRSPIMAELQENAKLRTDAATNAAEAQVKAQKVFADKIEADLQNQLNRQLITYSQFYNQRIELARQAGEAEFRLQEEKIRGLEARRKLELDPQRAAALGLDIRQARSEQGIQQEESRSRQEALRIERDTKIRDSSRETIAQSKQIAAQYGGETEALENIVFQLERELEANQALEPADKALADRNSDIKYQVSLYDELKKSRDRAYQGQLEEFELTRRQLDVDQQVRDVNLSRINRQEQRGEISEGAARSQRNELTRAALADNLIRQESLRDELAFKRARKAEEMKMLEDKLLGTTKSAIDQQAELTEAERAHNKELETTQSQLLATELAYAELAATVESYSLRLKMAISDAFSDALTEVMMDFRKAGEAWKAFAQSIQREIASTLARRVTQSIFSRIPFPGLPGRGGGGQYAAPGLTPSYAEGGPVSGPGTGTSDSIPAMVSAGEHIMPAAKASQWMPLLEGIRLGRIQAFANGGAVQSIAMGSVIPRRYANGGQVVADGGASAVAPGGGISGPIVVQLHPDAMRMNLTEWLQQEVVRQHGRR